MMIDWSKPIRTTCGKSARVICTDRKWTDIDSPLVLLVDVDGCEIINCADVQGKSRSYTFENVPEKRVVWINVYPTLDGDEYFHDVETADDWASEDRIACVRVEYEIPVVEVNE